MQPLQNHRSNNSSSTLSPYSQRFWGTEGIPVSICLATSGTKAMETYPWVAAASLTAPGWTRPVLWISPSLHTVPGFPGELQTVCNEFKFPDQLLAFFSYLAQTPAEAVCELLGYTSTSEVMRTAVLAPMLSWITPLDFSNSPLLRFGPGQPFQITVRHCLGDSQARDHSQLVIMDKASLFWEGKGMESSQTDVNQAMYFLPSWPTVPVVEGFPESELESCSEFNGSQLIFLPWICPNACWTHGKL